MVIRILNGRGNALYYLGRLSKMCESYHKAMVINPKGGSRQNTVQHGYSMLKCKDLETQ